MRNSVIIVLAGIVLMAEALVAHADNAGPVKAPAVGTANPAPPAGAPDIGAPPPKAAPANAAVGTSTGSVADGQAGQPAPTATDTSTAAPGGQAESSRNGALSSPPDGKSVHRNKPAAAPSGGEPK